jgi:hypothetical protein
MLFVCLCVTCSLRKVRKMNVQKSFPLARPPAFLMFEFFRCIFTKLDIRNIDIQSLMEFSFGFYRSSTSPTE